MNFHDHDITGYNDGWEPRSRLQNAEAEKDPERMNASRSSK